MDFEAMASELEENHDYRVLRRFKSPQSYGELVGPNIKSLCVLDFETTGVESEDKAIEIGMIRIEYDAEKGVLGRILDRYSALEDPGAPLPEHIVKLTGLTDEQVRNQRFDDARIKEIASASSVIVAHNAEFDRGFGERRFDFMAERPWACSLVDVPWRDVGDIGSGKLEFIAFKLGFFYDAHRAIADCEVTAGVLNTPLKDGKTGLWHLLQTARRPHYRVWATGAHISTKNVMKAEGYVWRDVPGLDEKAWRIETDNPNAHCDFLKQWVYPRGGQVLLEDVGHINRFTNRRVKSEYVTL
jgi:DNA polymerase-3 subunit epsilon